MIDPYEEMRLIFNEWVNDDEGLLSEQSRAVEEFTWWLQRKHYRIKKDIKAYEKHLGIEIKEKEKR